MSIEEVDFGPNSFDIVLVMGNNFGLFGDFKKRSETSEEVSQDDF